jgi:hypothetical protein
MAKKRSEGLEALVPKQEPISIQEITMQDWYAAFAMLNWPPMTNNKDAAKECWDRAEAMMEERNRRM